jgi:Ras-related protein Rab-1A
MASLSSSGGTQPQQVFKLLLIGESRVGKSSIINRFSGDSFTDNTMSTVGVDFKNREMIIDDKPVKLQIWDSAGQERFRSIVTSYYRGAHGVMVVYDTTARESFEKVKDWMAQLDEHAAESACRVLVGNKCDLTSKRAVSAEEGQALAESLGVPFLETSAKTSTNVEAAFVTLARQVRAKALTKPLHKPSVRIGDDGKNGHTKEKEESCC